MPEQSKQPYLKTILWDKYVKTRNTVIAVVGMSAAFSGGIASKDVIVPPEQVQVQALAAIPIHGKIVEQMYQQAWLFLVELDSDIKVVRVSQDDFERFAIGEYYVEQTYDFDREVNVIIEAEQRKVRK